MVKTKRRRTGIDSPYGLKTKLLFTPFEKTPQASELAPLPLWKLKMCLTFFDISGLQGDFQ
jgi:hypothetical protein